ncbi:glycerophosphodiester phosphodiesterase family protein [Qipengyuania sp. MTN3-11]|uniref:glycerophosphodiester phosphodiesterase family protein n=1 Tax=Qipengyuania sp. MTN3-11 TaxID=3056557 RepID=UPI0036F42FE1
MRSLPLRALDRLLTSPPDPARVGWLAQWTYAHRGLHGDDLPENTLLAFAAAADVGLGIECDIQRSADGTAMVFHDWDLERLVESEGALGLHASDFLETLRYRGREFGIARLVTLLELVDARVPVLIEIKSRPGYDIERSCTAVEAGLSGYRGRHAVMSFDPRVSRWFRENSPQTVRGLVMREDAVGHTRSAWHRHLALWIARPDFIAYHVDALPNRFTGDLRRRGFPVLTWTVDSARKRETARLHADAPIAEGAGLG